MQKKLLMKVYRIIFFSLFRNIFILLRFIFYVKKIPVVSYKINSKKSDTIYILGSGSSIQNIKNWNLIKKNHSIGFNWWILHSFVPDYYFLETPIDEPYLEYLLNVISFRSKDYKNTFFFHKFRWKSERIEKILLKENLKYKYYFPFQFYCKNMSDLNNFTKNFFFQKIVRKFLFTQGVASIEQLVLFAFNLGFKNIVLCGVDLNNNNYFFDNNSYVSEKILNKVSLEYLKQEHSPLVHFTNDPNLCYNGVRVQDVLEIYQKNILKNDCQIYVENSKSELAKIFPIWKLS